MCGICGFVGFREPGLLRAMTETLTHRGPDADGFYEFEDVGLGHRRLSIIDVSGGRQPIANETDDIVVICNGEIYNYRELREELRARGHRFRTESDSEVLVHLYEDFGPAMMARLNGMYAFAIYDERQRCMFLGRDRLGIKPLYYAVLPGGRLLFGSEMKAVLQAPEVERTLETRAVHDYLALRYVPGPGTLFREVQKLPAGHWARLRGGRFEQTRYWSPTLHSGTSARSERDCLEELEHRFQKSIRRRLMSEVPLGAYLSGGLDSSLIVAAMARESTQPVRTFSVGFDFEHDELADAAETARLLGCRHTEIQCRPQDAGLLPDLVYHLDEPVGDPIVIPMFQLAREAKKQVTVILSGEGADEILGGYLFHKVLLHGYRVGRLLPGPVRNGVVAPALSAVPSRLLDLAFSYPADLGRRGKQKVVDYVRLLGGDQLPEAYRHLISLFDERDVADLYTPDFRNSIGPAVPTPEEQEVLGSDAAFLNRALHLQFAHWLPDDILMKQDKMSMASAIEARVPYMDHELVEFALSLPPRLKVRGLTSKFLLRRMGRSMLPEAVVRRRKMPFYVPLERYATEGPFREIVEDTLSDRQVRDRGMFRPEVVRRLKGSLASGEFVFSKQVFSLVVLELWMRMVIDRVSNVPAASAGR